MWTAMATPSAGFDWSSFWPAFLATALGVLLGIPAGLLLNSWIQRLGTRRTHRANRERLSGTLLALKVSIDSNRRSLMELARISPTTGVFGSNLDLATWDMVLPDVQALVSSVEYRNNFAQYFQDIRSLVELTRDLNTFTVGANAAMDTAPGTRAGILGLISQRVSLALAKGDWLKEQIVEAEGRLTLQEPPGPIPAFQA